MAVVQLYIRWVAVGTQCTDLMPIRIIAMQHHAVELDMWIEYEQEAVVSYLDAVQGPLHTIGVRVSLATARARILAKLGPLHTVGGYNMQPILHALNFRLGEEIHEVWDARDAFTVANPMKVAMGIGSEGTQFSLDHLVQQMAPKLKLVLTDEVSRIKAVDVIYWSHRNMNQRELAALLTAIRPRATRASRCGTSCDGVCLATLLQTPCACGAALSCV
jgi:hypothetical protein